MSTAQVEQALDLAFKYLPQLKWSPDYEYAVLYGDLHDVHIFVGPSFATMSTEKYFIQAKSRKAGANQVDHLNALIEFLPKEYM